MDGFTSPGESLTWQTLKHLPRRFDPERQECTDSILALLNLNSIFQLAPIPMAMYSTSGAINLRMTEPEGQEATSISEKELGIKNGLKKRVRPVPSNGILSSSHFPPEHDGNFLISNAIGFLGVAQHKVNYNGADISAVEVEPIVSSSDPNFRPSDMEIGGDGALYITDWHNALIGHMQHNMRDPNRDHAHGRVYRVTYEGRPLVDAPKNEGENDP